jgi:hypothetical protein
LTPEGIVTVNLFGKNSSYDNSLDKIIQVFGEDAVWAFEPTKEGNIIVLAQRTPYHPEHDVLLTQAKMIEERFKLPATTWLTIFKPV